MPKVGSIPTDWLIDPYFDPALVAPTSTPDEDPIVDLTPKEIEIIIYALDVVDRKRLADAFATTPYDVDRALNHIYLKLE